MNKEELNKIFENFEVSFLDPNDPEVIKLLEETKKRQEKVRRLQENNNRIEPYEMNFKSQEFTDFCKLVVENTKSF